MNLTAKLHGREVEGVYTNGSQLLIRTADGSEILVAWVDDNGVPIKGKPVVSQSGYRLLAQGINDLIYHPRIRTHGAAA